MEKDLKTIPTCKLVEELKNRKIDEITNTLQDLLADIENSIKIVWNNREKEDLCVLKKDIEEINKKMNRAEHLLLKKAEYLNAFSGQDISDGSS